MVVQASLLWTLTSGSVRTFFERAHPAVRVKTACQLLGILRFYQIILPKGCPVFFEHGQL